MMRISETVKHLIIINVIMFIGTLTVGGGQLFYDWFSLYFTENEAFQPWQIITHMFMHGGPAHLLFNMFALWMFGSSVEYSLGKKRFLFLYFSAGLGAVLFQLSSYYLSYFPVFSELQASGISNETIINIMNTGSWNFPTTDLQEIQLNKIYPIYNSTMVGASGCLFGVLVAFGVLNPNAELMLIFLPIPIKAKYLISLYVGYDIISGFFGGSSIFGANIAHWAHVGGAVIGFIIIWYWKKTQFNKNRWN